MKKNLVYTLIALFASMQIANAQTLDDYFKIAAENNPGLRAKHKEFEIAMQKLPQVNSLPDPNFSFGYFVSPVETRVGPQIMRLSLTQMFPWFGTLEAQENTAALYAKAKYQSFLNERNKLYYRLASVYYSLYEINKLIEIERENIEILESYKSISISKFENSQGSMVDALRVDLSLEESSTDIEILNKSKAPLIVDFNNILNRRENEEPAIADTINIEGFSKPYPKDSLLVNNPVLEEIEFKMDAARASEISAQKQGLPKFGFGLDYVMIGERNDINPADNGKDAFMPMITFSIPIYRGKYDAAEKEAQLQHESYSLQKDDAVNYLTSKYEEIRFKLQKQMDLIALYNKQIQTTEQSLNLLFTDYSNSGKDFVELLRMQQLLLKYSKLKLKALVKYQIALTELDYITAKNKF